MVRTIFATSLLPIWFVVVANKIDYLRVGVAEFTFLQVSVNHSTRNTREGSAPLHAMMSSSNATSFDSKGRGCSAAVVDETSEKTQNKHPNIRRVPSTTIRVTNGSPSTRIA